MVTIVQKEDGATRYSGSRGEDGVLRAYESISSLIDGIKATGNLFTALSLVNEINDLNGYKVIGDFEIKNIKNHFLKNKMFTSESRSVKIKSEILKSHIPKKEIVNIKSDNTERRFRKAENKMRDLQKDYVRLLSV